MGDILIRALFFFLMIALAYALKKAGVLKKEDSSALSRLILNVTLPCAILASFRTFVFDYRLMMIPLIGFLSNCLMLYLGYIISRKKERDDKIFYMLNLPAYNIGNFTLPFVSGLLGASGVISACLFDMGNAVMCVGANVIITSMVVNGVQEGTSIPKALLKVFTKPAFTVYFIMLILSALGLRIPDFVFDFASSISPANGIIAMFMLGLMMEFRFTKELFKEVISVNILRLILAFVIAMLFYKFAPFDLETRKAVAITAFAPISSAAPAFTEELKGNIELAGFAGSVSIVIALVLIPLLIILL